MTIDPSKLTPYKDIAAANASLRQISEDAFYVINEASIYFEYFAWISNCIESTCFTF